MCTRNDGSYAGGLGSGPERFCLCLIEFISGHATDPHLYFQSKLSSDLAQVNSVADLWRLLEQLIDWVERGDHHSSAIERLDRNLIKSGLPSYSLVAVRGNHELARILLSRKIVDRAEYKIVKTSINNTAGLGSADRDLCERLVKCYEL